MTDEHVDDEQVVRAEALVREGGAVAVTRLTEGLRTRDAGAVLVDALIRRGLEKAAKVVRVPLPEQLTTLIQREGEVPLAGIDKRLAGAGGAEAKRAVLALATAGTVVLGKRGRSEHVAWADGRVADAAELQRAATSITELKSLVKELEKRLRGKPQYALLEEELDGWRARVREAVAGPVAEPALSRGEFDTKRSLAAEAAPDERPATTPAPVPETVPETVKAPTSDGVADRVLRTLASFDRDPLLHLVYLPDLVRALGRSGVGVADVHAALQGAAKGGDIELRHESDPERLSAADRGVCMVAPSGRLISYVHVRPD